ncbi:MULTISPECIES: type IV pilin protein [Luteimonas]|uniref:type IV pilin protein n=1 Tax=Luteimonas TaxID=83614 RepID=UPI000C7D41E3|nr:MULTISPECIES: type IV pilin protein [Luteimonas]
MHFQRRPLSAAGRQRGFTLIELMVVVAIVAILVGIALPMYQDAVRKGHRGQAKADMVELAQRAERYRTINGSYDRFWERAVPPGDRNSPRTGEVRYLLTREGGDSATTTFVIQAVPQGGQANDARCMTLRIDQAGQKTATGPGMDCW